MYSVRVRATPVTGEGFRIAPSGELLPQRLGGRCGWGKVDG